MNWIARNVAVVIFGAATSIAVVAYMLYVEASGGQALFSYNAQALVNIPAMAYIPLGAIFAGFAGAAGYLAVAMFLRLRPGGIILAVILAVSFGIVYMAQSAEGTLATGKHANTKSAATFGHFLISSTVNSPVHYWSTDPSTVSDEASDADSSSPETEASAQPEVPAGASQTAVSGISSGVSGMMVTQKMNNSGTVKQLNAMGENVDTISSGVSAHGMQWVSTGLDGFGFALGSLLVYFYLRSLNHCEDCMLLFSKKGEKTRYYIRSPEMRNSVDEVLNQARERHLRESIKAHMAKGSDKKTKWAEYSSTLEISRCKSCDAHRLSYHTFRKEGSSWKDIAVMGFTATTLEPLDFA